MNKKNTVIFIVFTLISAFLAYKCANNFFDFTGMHFVIAAALAVISATGNPTLSVTGGIITVGCAFISGSTEGVILLVFVVIFALLAGYCIKNACSTAKLVIVFAVGFFFSSVAYIGYLSGVSGLNIVENFVNHIKPEFVQVMTEYMTAMEMSDYQAVVEEFINGYFVYIQNTIPAILITMSLIFAFLSACVVSFMLRITKMRHLFKVKFSEFVCDRTTTIVFLISAVLSMLMETGVIQTVFMNIFIILLFVFQVCGFSLLDGILKKKGMPLGVRALILLLVMLFATSGITLIIIIVSAVIDSFRNFRAIGAVNENDGDDNNDNGCD